MLSNNFNFPNYLIKKRYEITIKIKKITFRGHILLGGMDQRFTDNLDNIIISHINDENFGADDLASLLGLSTSQALRKVKAATGKSVNQYIREVRLAEAAKLIRETDFTSAEISYKVGFGSPSYFNKSFSKHFGITPGLFKAQESTLKENTLIKDAIKNQNTTPIYKKSTKGRYIIISSILVLLLATLAYYFYQNPKKDNNPITSEIIKNDKSIAILPFKNLSSNKDNQYFADGVMEVILNHLASIKELTVIPSTSTEQYRETTKTIPEMAKELGVSYILQASFQKELGEIRIITHLIDAKNNKEISSTDLKKDYKDIFELQSTIAQQISKKLNTELSNAERNQIEKKPTNNLEAYNLYLQGVYFIRNGSAIKSLPYFEQAIEKDPQFAFAYSYLGIAYGLIVSSGSLSHDDYIKKSKELAQKAIDLDPSIGQPHQNLALLLLRYDYNWKAAEEEFLISLKLDPKDAFTNLLYSKLLNYTGRIEESREQVNKAMLLNPAYHGNYRASANYYYYSGNYKKALSENKKGLDVKIKSNETNWLNFDIHIAQKQYDNAIIDLQKLVNENKPNEIENIYKLYGIKGVYNWLIKIDSINDNYNTPYLLAQKYAFIGAHEKALEQLEKSFKMRVSLLPSINRDPYFKILRSEPRFINIIKKMGLDDYKVPD